MAILLASDLHLDPAHPAPVEAFLRFLDGPAQDASALYLLGDLFEAWVGDDDDDPLVATVADALSRRAAAGLEICFQHGNRDFLLGAAYAARCSMSLLGEAEVHDIGPVPTLLMHGDQLCTRDHAYQAFRRTARSPDWQQQFLSRPLAARRAFAAGARAESREHTATTVASIMDVDPEAVREALLAAGVRRLIHGHTHRPAIHHIMTADGFAERIVLPDWSHRAGWAVVEGGSITLIETPLDR